jgi:hypothetical protein
MITVALIAVAGLLPANCVVHRIRRGRWEWTAEEGFFKLN